MVYSELNKHLCVFRMQERQFIQRRLNPLLLAVDNVQTLVSIMYEYVC